MTKKSEMPDLFGRATLVLGGHGGLRETVQVLRKVAAAIRGREAVSHADARSRVHAFADRLLSHFAAEERPEYFGALSSESAALEQAIAGLRVEHQEMMRKLALLREIEDLERDAHEFSGQLEALLDFITEHERREHELLEQFFRAD